MMEAALQITWLALLVSLFIAFIAYIVCYLYYMYDVILNKDKDSRN